MSKNSSWKGYMVIGNGWLETITNVSFVHVAGDNPPDISSASSLAAGQITPVTTVTAYSKDSDSWSVSFTTSDGTVHKANIPDAGFKEEDADAILFAQVTKANGRFSLYFPVSSDEYVPIA